MANDLAIIENNLTAIAPEFMQAIPPAIREIMPAERLIRTLMVSLERNERLQQCSMASLVNAAWSAAVLGLEIDGYTGQAFLVPYKIKGVLTAQLQIGYKGFNTLMARSGYTPNSGVYREGDGFDYELGSNPYIKHLPMLGRGSTKRNILAAWASATPQVGAPMCAVLSIEDVMAVKARSKGAKERESPWNDMAVGFPAMAEKTAKRRLARQMPLNVVQLASALDTMGEIGRLTHIEPKSRMLVVDQKTVDDPATLDAEAEKELVDFDKIYAIRVNSAGKQKQFKSWDECFGTMTARLENMQVNDLEKFAEWNKEIIQRWQFEHPREAQSLLDIITLRLEPSEPAEE